MNVREILQYIIIMYSLLVALEFDQRATLQAPA